MRRVNKLSFWILCLCFLASCVEDQEGCLDPQASNFDPSADVNEGCDYPNLILNFLYHFNDSSYYSDSAYYRATFDDSIKILDFGFVLGQFELCQVGSCIPLETVSDIYAGDAADSMLVTIMDDLIYIRPNRFNFTSGETRPKGVYDQLGFTSGVPSDWRNVRPFSLTSGHAMRELANDGYWSESEGFKSFYLDVEFGSPINKAKTIIVDDSILKNGAFSANFEKRVGEDITLNLNLDLNILIGSIDFEQPDEALIISQILTNLEMAIHPR